MERALRPVAGLMYRLVQEQWYAVVALLAVVVKGPHRAFGN